jgi:shikimate kinase
MVQYYEYGPRLELERPAVVTGYLSDFTRGVCYRAAALLGLTFHDIDRMVEHDLGMDIARIVVERGEAHYREVEARILDRVLARQPAGLVALGDGGLLDPSSLERIRSGARLVVLDFDLGNLFWRAQQLARVPGRGPWHSLYWDAPATVADLRPFYQERRPGFETADMQIEANPLSVATACDELVDYLRS